MKRRLKLQGLHPARAAAIRQAVDEVMGVDMVSLNEDKSILNVAYDAGKVSIDAIEAIVHEHGAGIARGPWIRFKENWYRFTDQNVRDNKTREPWSCHRR